MTLLAGLLERAGMLDLADAEVEAAIAAAADAAVVAAARRADRGPTCAKQLAWSLLDRLPVIEGSGFLAAVARRWKTQLNENGKSAAAAEELPEATHNTVVGYQQPETMRDHQYVVFLASDADHAAQPRAGAAVDRSCSRRRASTTSASRSTARAGSAQACAAIILGDYVSFYLALLYGVDPSQTEALTLVKARHERVRSAGR